MNSFRLTLRLLLTLSAFAFGRVGLHAIDLPAATIQWRGLADGNWANPANWDPARVPNASDHVAIEDAGVEATLTINANPTIASLRLGTAGGTPPRLLLPAGRGLTLTSGGDVGPTGHFHEAGDIAGVPLEVRGRMTWSDGRNFHGLKVLAGGRLEVTGDVAFSSGSGNQPKIENQGTLVLGGSITLWYQALIENRGLIEITYENSLLRYCCGGGQGTLVNLGTVAKTSGTGTTTVNAAWWDNSGTIRVDSGSIDMGFNATWRDGTRIEGAGVLRTVDGVHNFSGRMEVPGGLEFAGGRFDGGAVFAATGRLRWVSGRINGALTNDVGSTWVITGAADKHMSSGAPATPATLANRGLVRWEAGVIFGWDQSRILNEGRWELAGDGNFFTYCCGGGVGTYLNTGTLAKTAGSGASLVGSAYLDQRGTVRVDTGEFQLTYQSGWSSGSRTEGVGPVRLVSGDHGWSGQTELGGPLEFAGGNIRGTGVFSGAAPLRWLSGRILGAFTNTPATTFHLVGAEAKYLSSGSTQDRARWVNQGTVKWSGGLLYQWDQAVVRNEGRWEAGSDGTMLAYCCGGGIGPFENPGTLVKTAPGDGVVTISSTRLENSGVVDVPSGSIRLPSNNVWTDGSRITGAGRVELVSETAQFSGLTTLGGTLWWAGANVGGHLRFGGTGAVVWETGRLVGRLTVEPSGKLTMSAATARYLSSGNPAEPATLVNRGVVRQVAGTTYLYDQSVIENHGTWSVEQDGTFQSYCCGGGFGQFVNQGLLTKSAGGEVATLDRVRLRQVGTISSTSGTFDLSTDVSWADGARIAGTQPVRMVGGSATFDGRVRMDGPLHLAGADIYGTAVVAGPGVLTWGSSRLLRTFSVESNATVRFPAGGRYFSSGSAASPAVFTNRGNLRMELGAVIYAYDSTRMFNEGRWDIQGQGYAIAYCCGGGFGTLSNEGELVRSASDGSSYLSQVRYIGNGTLRVLGGNLEVDSGTVLGAGSTLAVVPGARLLSGGSLRVAGNLEILVPPGYDPDAGTSFGVVQASPRLGTFSDLIAPELPSGRSWSVDYPASAVTVTVRDDPCLGNGLVAWWPGESSGAELKGALQGTLTGVGFTEGVVGRAFVFSGGDNSYVTIPNFTPSPEWTVEAWVRPENGNTGRRGILGGWGACTDWGLAVLNGKLGVTYRPPGGCSQTLTTAEAYEVGRWYHLAATSDGAVVRLYLDGVEVGQAPTEVYGPYGWVTIGREICCSNSGFIGAVDEPAIYNRPLAPAEIAALHAAAGSGRCAGFGLQVIRAEPNGPVNTNVAQLTLRFNQPIRPESFTAADVTVTTPGGPVPTASITIEATADPRTALVRFPEQSAPGAYAVTVGPDILDFAGRPFAGGLPYRFAFDIDKTGPRVTRLDPVFPATGRVEWVELTFDTPIRPGSLTAAQVRFTGTGFPGIQSIGPAPAPAGTNTYRVRFNGVLPPGTYDLEAGVDILDLAGNRLDQDADGTPGEAIEDFFTARLEVKAADLRVVSVAGPPQALMGQSVPVLVVLTNEGAASAVGPWNNRFLLATNNTGGGAVDIGGFNFAGTLAPGTGVTVTQNLILPRGISGSRYIGVAADAANRVLELNRDNNRAFAAGQILVGAPDLTIASLGASPDALWGGTLSVNWGVRNAGSTPTLAAGVDRVYLALSSNSLAGSILLGSFASEALGAGATYSRNPTVSLPLNTGAGPGDYFVVVVTDASDAEGEADEANNSRAVPIRIGVPPLPDLVILGVQAPRFSASGVATEFQWSVTNVGTLGAAPGWIERLTFVPASGPTFLLGEFRSTNALDPASVLVRTQVITLPAGLAAGTYTVAVEVNPRREYLERSADNNVAVADPGTVIPRSLEFRVDSGELLEGAAPVEVTLARNSDPADSLVAMLTNGLPAVLEIPESVTFAAGQQSVRFPARFKPDGQVTGPRMARITAAANGHAAAGLVLQMTDTDIPALAFTLVTNRVSEGGTVAATVRRSGGTQFAIDVLFDVSVPGRLLPPLPVRLDVGQVEATFALVAEDDSRIAPSAELRVTALSPGYKSASANLTVLDGDFPSLQFTSSTTNLLESAGAAAAMATIRRAGPLDLPVVVQVEADVPGQLQLPQLVVLAAGEAESTFPIGVVNDSLANGTRELLVRTFVRLSGTIEIAGEGPALALAVRDDEGPALTLALSGDTAREGQAAAVVGTVRRNTATASALTVTLASGDLTEATVPATVVIPAGQAEVSFPVSTVDDGVIDGTQPATIAVSAPGFAPASAVLRVTDLQLPDLVVARLTAPATAESDGTAVLNWRVENRGSAPTAAAFYTRVFLSTSTAPGTGTLVAQNLQSDPLAPGQFIEQAVQFRLPRATGRYWLIAMTDATGAVGEVAEDNNTGVSSRAIEVTAPYTATVSTEVNVSSPGVAIPLTGRALRPGSNQAVPNVPVSIHILVRGTRRIVGAVSGADGTFTAQFQPLPNEAGRYDIGAAHPGESAATVQDTFRILGIGIAPAGDSVRLAQGRDTLRTFDVLNLADVPVTGLVASLVGVPANIDARVALNAAVLAAGGTNRVTLTVGVRDLSTTFGTFGLRIAGADGVVAEVPVRYSVDVPQPRLVARPGVLVAGMTRGRQASVEFEVANEGGAESGPLSVALPDIAWMTIAGENPLPSIPAGGSTRVTVLLTPPSDQPLGPYNGALSLNGSSAGLSVPFEFRALSDAKGTLVVKAEDEVTYYGAGNPGVTNARVVIRDITSRTTVTNGVTDAKGEFVVRDLPEAWYEIEVSADRHTTDRGNFLLVPGQTNTHTAFISLQTVRYTWTVVPTEIEDRTKIVIETTFETAVPAPVVTVEPSVIDVADMVGDSMQIDVSIFNHGLIAAEGVNIQFDGHPDFIFRPLVNDVGTLSARSGIVVPVYIERVVPTGGGRTVTLASSRSAGPAASPGAPCSSSGRVEHKLRCGPRTNNYTTPITVRNTGPCNGGPGGYGGGGYGWGGGYGGGGWGGGGGGGGGGFVNAPSISKKEPCDCKEKGFVPTCFEIGLSSGSPLDLAASSASSAILAPLNGSAEVKLNGNAKLCTCCDEEGEGLQMEATAEVEGAVGLAIPLVGKRIRKVERQGLGLVTIEAGIGCDLVLGGKLKGSIQRSTDCHFKNPKNCATVTLEASAGVECGAAGVMSFEPDAGSGEQAFSVGTKVSVGITGGMSGSYQSCDGKVSGKVCVNAINAEAVATAGIGDRSVTAKVTEELRPQECYDLDSPGDMVAAPAHVKDAFRQMAEHARRSEQEALQRSLGKNALASLERPRTRETRNAQPAAGDAVCARVKLRLEQELVLTRNAFNATLELFNDDPVRELSEITVSVQIFTTNGVAATDLFGIRTPDIRGLGAIDGTGRLAPSGNGSASFILVPTRDAAPEVPTEYGVGGYLSYVLDGKSVVIPLAPATITVLPDPRLVVQYFHERDVYSDDPFTRDIVEPTVPFNLGVMVANHGKGDARNVRIISGQPQIVENDKGLAIEFKIIATEVAGQSVSPGLTANFGLIRPGERGIGRWMLTSTLQGLFLDYKATFEHLDSLGKTNLSLIDAVSIHETIRLVHADRSLDDGRPDFLVNDFPDVDDLPDALYLSDGSTNAVRVVRDASVVGSLSGANRTVQLFVSPPSGWVYFRLPDPSAGRLRLSRLTRADGTEVAVGTNAWTTDRTFIGRGQRPVAEKLLHFLDLNPGGSYTAEFIDPVANDTNAPISKVEPLAAASYASIPVLWTGGDEPGGSGLAGFDIFVSVDGGPFVAWLQNTTARSAVYRGEEGRSYAFYSIAFDKAGNREAAPAAPQATTRVSLENRAPVIAAIAPVTVDEGGTAVIDPAATDPDGHALGWSLGPGAPAGATIDPINGRVSWATGESDGPGSFNLSVIVRDSGVPPLRATNIAQITVREVNTPPTLAPVAGATLLEGQQFSVQLVATDDDVPAQTVGYAFVGTPPAGMTLNATGLLRWRPTEFQGGRSYPVTVAARDNGTPALSATRTFTLVVRDSVGDFALRLGRTNVLRGGAAAEVPVEVESGQELTALRFDLVVPPSDLSGLNLLPFAPEVGGVTLRPGAGGRSTLELSAAVGASFAGRMDLARLGFQAPAGADSSALNLVPESVVATRPDGSTILNPRLKPGRVFIVGERPLVDLEGEGAGRKAVVYGRPGVRYRVESSPVYGPAAAWSSRGTLPSAFPAGLLEVGTLEEGDQFFRGTPIP